MTNNTDKMVSDALRGSWVHKIIPQSLWPYAQLARWERPIGWQLLMWPCWWSIMLAVLHDVSSVQVSQSTLTNPALNGYIPLIILPLIISLVLFLLGAVLMRGAGCTYNDLTDEDIDIQVARTRSRPLPSGRVSRKKAWLFLGLQLLLGFIILVTFNVFSIWLGAASLITVAIYPFMKRITWWPQLFLGFAFSWGALMGWAVIFEEISPTSLILYLGCIFWVIGYDTIYAHQDREDDALVGVKSTARLFADKSKVVIAALYAVAILLFAVSFALALPIQNWRFSPAFLGLAIGGVHMIWQIKSIDIDDGDQCLHLFKSNTHFGLILFLGLAVSVLLNLKQLAFMIS